MIVLLSLIALLSFARKPSQQKMKVVRIGTQEWSAVNLQVAHFRNGDPIPVAIKFKDWTEAAKNKMPICASVDGDEKNDAIYGKIYNGYAILDPRGLAPKGWRIPSDDDWNSLENFLGDSAGYKIKSVTGWKDGGNGSNRYGFNAIPAGYFDAYYLKFTGKGTNASWWTCSNAEAADEALWERSLVFRSERLLRLESHQREGKMVRCIKNE